MENKLRHIGITIILTEVEKLLGIANNENDNIKLMNLINMAIKQYIHTCRCFKITPIWSVGYEENKRN